MFGLPCSFSSRFFNASFSIFCSLQQLTLEPPNLQSDYCNLHLTPQNFILAAVTHSTLGMDTSSWIRATLWLHTFSWCCCLLSSSWSFLSVRWADVASCPGVVCWAGVVRWVGVVLWTCVACWAGIVDCPGVLCWARVMGWAGVGGLAGGWCVLWTACVCAEVHVGWRRRLCGRTICSREWLRCEGGILRCNNCNPRIWVWESGGPLLCCLCFSLSFLYRCCRWSLQESWLLLVRSNCTSVGESVNMQ